MESLKKLLKRLSGTSEWSHESTQTIRTVRQRGGDVQIFNNAQIQGEGPSVEQPRTVGSFTGVRSSAMADLQIRIANEYRVVVYGQANILKFLETVIEGNTLVVRMKNGSYSTTESLRVEVWLPNLVSLEASGHGQIVVSGLDSPSLQVRHSGMGDMFLSGTARVLDCVVQGHGRIKSPQLHCDKLLLKHSGMGDLVFTGNASEISIRANGHGDIDLSAFSAKTVDLKHSGMGDIHLRVSETVAGSASGHGDVLISGGAKGQVRHTGLGKISFA